MTETEENSHTSLDGFIKGLSSVNFLFAFAMTLFNYTILTLLYYAGIPLIYGGLGISIGQGILLFAVIPLGRMIDKGKSYAMMATGSLLYGAVLMGIYAASFNSSYFFIALVTMLVGSVLIFQNVFKSSLSSFIAKAVRAKVMGASYARIIWMEAAGGTISLLIAVLSGNLFPLRLLYLGTGILLVLTSLASFTFVARKNRLSLKLEASRVRRPSFMESLALLRNRGRFTVALMASKVFMSIGVLGFSYFYVITGIRIGVGEQLSLLSLFAASALGIPFGMWAERFVSRHVEWGKIYIVMMGAIDIISYGFILMSLNGASWLLFFAAPLVGSPGPFLIPGALTYEVKVIGKENRGIFSGIQRTFTAIPAIALGAPLTYIFTLDPSFMWGIVVASAVATLASSLLIPSRKYLDEKYGLSEPAAPQ